MILFPIRIISDLPTIENTEPVAAFRATSPQFYRDSDQALLYYGSDTWDLALECRLVYKEDGSSVVILPFNGIELPYDTKPEEAAGPIVINFPIWLFVLNESLIIHFVQGGSCGCSFSISIPYQSIFMSGLRDGLTKLYLCVDVDAGATCELVCSPGDSSSVDYPLFRAFSQLSSRQALEAAYSGINECIGRTSTYQEDTSDDNDEKGPENGFFHGNALTSGSDVAFTEVMLDESGQADDELNDVLLQVSSDGENSAMKVALNGGSVTGVKRAPQRRGSDSDHKARRLG